MVMSSGKRAVCTDEVAHYGYAVREKGGLYGRGSTLWLYRPGKGRFLRMESEVFIPDGELSRSSR